ncbi:alpha/beta hydrolase [Streptomyces sp. NPDC013455]|uniref:alpha/beta fold hydrolase n=1 Tax=Streptomyces sp. NPDC013455 TaxID=3155605 RepID=UPI0034043A9D
MAHFLLVAGAWLGAWAWDDVVPDLRAAGHGTQPLTLSGLAEKRGVPARQHTHVEDIVRAVTQPAPGGAGPRDVVLVAHSYAGFPAAQAAGRTGARPARLILVDSPVPVDGEPCLARWPDRRAVEAAIARNGGFWPPPDRRFYAGHDLTEERITRVMEASTPHPGDTLTEPAVLTSPLRDIPTTYVRCLRNPAALGADVTALLGRGQWRLVELETGHWPMFSRPHELAEVLLREAAGAGRAAARADG